MTGSGSALLAAAHERFALQDYYGAIHHASQLVEQGQAFADAHHLLGLCYALVNQPQRALEEFDRALALNPRYLEAHLHRALTLMAAGRGDEAERAFGDAAAVAPGPVGGYPATVAARLANMHAALAEAYAETGDLARAIAEYERALALGPSFHDVRYRMARVLLEAGRVLDARDALQRVVDAQPRFLEAQAALGLAHFLSGEAAEARRLWTACLAERPGNTRIEAYLAMIDRGTAG